MSITFGRLGRAFLMAAAAAAIAALLAFGLLPDPAGSIVGGVLGILTVVAFCLGAVFTLVQHRMFGSPAALARVAASGVPAQATVTTVNGSVGRINADPIMRLGLVINGTVTQRRVLVPIQHVAALRPGATLPVRIDPSDTRPLVVDWAALP